MDQPPNGLGAWGTATATPGPHALGRAGLGGSALMLGGRAPTPRLPRPAPGTVARGPGDHPALGPHHTWTADSWQCGTGAGATPSSSCHPAHGHRAMVLRDLGPPEPCSWALRCHRGRTGREDRCLRLSRAPRLPQLRPGLQGTAGIVPAFLVPRGRDSARESICVCVKLSLRIRGAS